MVIENSPGSEGLWAIFTRERETSDMSLCMVAKSAFPLICSTAGFTFPDCAIFQQEFLHLKELLLVQILNIGLIPLLSLLVFDEESLPLVIKSKSVPKSGNIFVISGDVSGESPLVVESLLAERAGIVQAHHVKLAVDTESGLTAKHFTAAPTGPLPIHFR